MSEKLLERIEKLERSKVDRDELLLVLVVLCIALGILFYIFFKDITELKHAVLPPYMW